MLLTTLQGDPEELERRTGWQIKPEGACKADRCVPLPASSPGRIDVRALAERLGMPLLHDAAHDVWCLGPESGGMPSPALRRLIWCCRISTGTPSRCSPCAGRRCCSWPGPPGEGAALTCPCGRHCAPNSTRSAWRWSPSPSTPLVRRLPAPGLKQPSRLIRHSSTRRICSMSSWASSTFPAASGSTRRACSSGRPNQPFPIGPTT